MDERIDRSKLKDPSEVSGWGRRDDGRALQDSSDIAKKSERNVEFDPAVGHLSDKPICQGDVKMM